MFSLTYKNSNFGCMVFMRVLVILLVCTLYYNCVDDLCIVFVMSVIKCLGFVVCMISWYLKQTSSMLNISVKSYLMPENLMV